MGGEKDSHVCERERELCMKKKIGRKERERVVHSIEINNFVCMWVKKIRSFILAVRR